MASQQEKSVQFKQLHIKGDPLLLFNIWDPDSAKAVAGEGAVAIATSHHAIANSYGYEDGESMPLGLCLDNMQRIVEAVDLPVTVDFETGYGTTPDEVYTSVNRALATGIVGLNIEDRAANEGEIRDTADACARIAAVRRAAEDRGIELFINGRTNLFFYASPEEQADGLTSQLLEKAQAFKDAGADGFFAPGISDIEQIRRLCDASPLPVNIIWFPGFPSTKDIAEAGASRISYGPGPYLAMLERLKAEAKRVFAFGD